MICKIDSVVNQLHTRGIRVIHKDKTLNIKVQLHDSMKDLKYKKMLSGLGGADCILCTTKQKEWSDIAKVTEGFPINRNAQGNEALFHRLVNDQGIIPRIPNDFANRQGLTSKPLTTSSQRSITITHSYINGTAFFIKFLVRVHIDYARWEEKSDPRGAPLRAGKARVLAAIEDQTGLVVEQVASTGHCGTSTDGNTGRRFFSSELRPVLEELISENYRDNALLLHLQLSSILRIVSCTAKVDIDKYEELTKKTGLNLAVNFPWVRLNYTMHGTVQHSAELIRDNGNQGLGDLSEEALEANNKDIRKMLADYSRKTDPVAQLTDTAHRLLERSHPNNRRITAQFRPSKSCSECGGKDHTVRTHHKAMGSGVRGLYDSIVCDILT